jgi:hypothetical protein
MHSVFEFGVNVKLKLQETELLIWDYWASMYAYVLPVYWHCYSEMCKKALQ